MTKALMDKANVKTHTDEYKKEANNLQKSESFDWDAFENGHDADLVNNNDTEITVGSIIDGVITNKDLWHVTVKLNDHLSGILSTEEIRYIPYLNRGDSIKVKIIQLEDYKGNVGISHQAVRYDLLGDLESYYQKGATLQGRITFSLGFLGFLVDVMGELAFLPKSQILLDNDSAFEGCIGKCIEVKIVLLEKESPLLVVSQKAVISYDIPNYNNEVDDYFERFGYIVQDENYTKIEEEDKDDERYEQALNNPPPRSSMRNTGGELRPCPYCNSNMVETYVDGTVLCLCCYKWYRYI